MFRLQSNFINKYIPTSVNYVNIETWQSLLKIKKNLNMIDTLFSSSYYVINYKKERKKKVDLPVF